MRFFLRHLVSKEKLDFPVDIGPPNVFTFLINVTHAYRMFSTFVYAVFSTLMVCKAKFYIFDYYFTFSCLRNDRKMDKKCVVR